LLAVSLMACEAGGPAHFTWTEDVQLADGSVIQVHREIHYSGTSREAGGPAGTTLGEAVVQILSSDPKQSVPWRMRLEPVHVEKNPDNGEWTILAAITDVDTAFGATCDLWVRYGKLATPEVAFALQRGAWVQVPVPSAFVGQKVNLLPGVPRREGVSSVSLEQKSEWIGRMGPSWDTVQSDLQIGLGRQLPLQCERYLRGKGLP